MLYTVGYLLYRLIVLTLLHGFSGGAASWDPLDLESSRLCVPTLPGHAGGPILSSDTSFEGGVSQVAAGLPGSSVLVGYSLGARIALALALQCPDRVRALVLIGVNPGLLSPEARAERRRADQSWIRLLRDEGIRPFEEAWAAQRLFESQRTVSAGLKERQRDIRRTHDPEQLARALETFGLAQMPNFWPDLAKIDPPVTLVTGQEDPKFDGIAEQISQVLPEARHERISGAGHNVLLEAPAALSAIVERFWRSVV